MIADLYLDDKLILWIDVVQYLTMCVSIHCPLSASSKRESVLPWRRSFQGPQLLSPAWWFDCGFTQEYIQWELNQRIYRPLLTCTQPGKCFPPNRLQNNMSFQRRARSTKGDMQGLHILKRFSFHFSNLSFVTRVNFLDTQPSLFL